MSAIHIANGNVRLFGTRLFIAVVVLALLAVGALTLRMALATSNSVQPAASTAGETAAVDPGIAARWAALDEAYRKQYELLIAEQAERNKSYWGAADEAYRRQYDLLTASQSERRKAFWAAADEAYRQQYDVLTAGQVERQKAYWAAADEAYRRQYELVSTDRAERQKAYWAAVNEAHQKRYALSGASGR